MAGWTIFATGKPHPVVNQAIAPLDARAADVAAVLASIRKHTDLFLIHVWDDVAADIGEALVAEGLNRGEPRPFMVRAAEGIKAKTPDGVEIERVSDLEALAHFRAVDREAFDDPGVIAEVFAPDAILDEPRAGLFLALLDGVPVATATAAITGDVAGIFGVATLESARKRGIGTAVTAAACAFAYDRGCDLLYLQATPMGLPIYERMGFETLGYYRGYMTPLSAE